MSERDLLNEMHESVSDFIERLEDSESENINDLLETATAFLQSIDTTIDLM